MTTEKPKAHFTDNYLINATNPITVNLIGAGGTGSKVLTALVEMNISLIALGHAGLSLRLWDDDTVTEANLGRQRFAQCETGMHKSVALINRANRFAGSAWKAETVKFQKDCLGKLPEHTGAVIYISCVDSVASRFEIADMIRCQNNSNSYTGKSRYWLDFGNSQYTGQVILSTIGAIAQPDSKKYQTVATLPFVTEEFGELLRQSETTDDTPSCSLAEALEKQDLYINGSLAQLGSSLLWGLFRNGMTLHRGFFLNLSSLCATALPVG